MLKRMYAHARAPVRIGIAGGGTDLPAWTRERRGLCLSLAIRTYAHAFAFDRPDGQVVASYSHLDRAPRATEIGNGLIRESALAQRWVTGFEVHTGSQVPSHGSGLGVSSSIAVALAACFDRLSQLRAERESPSSGDAYRHWVARCAWGVEIDRLGRPIGRQDHMSAAYGGLRLYAFERNEAEVERIFPPEEAAWVAEHLLLLRLPEGHDAGAILSGVKSTQQLQVAHDAVEEALGAVSDRDAPRLGRALGMGQASKMKIPGAVPASVAEVLGRVSAVRGVWGCKVCGAGGGGHAVVACEPGAREEVAAAAQLPALPVAPDLDGVRSEGQL